MIVLKDISLVESTFSEHYKIQGYHFFLYFSKFFDIVVPYCTATVILLSKVSKEEILQQNRKNT